MAEISADKDAVRAEYAMTVRRLEMTIKSLREEAIADSLASGRAHDETRDAARAQLATEHAAELETLGALYNEASITASSRQIELVAQEQALDEEKRRVTALEQKNSELVTALSEVQEKLEQRERKTTRRGGTKPSKDAEDAAGIAQLREQIKDLAAEMVSITAQIEGAGSEIHQVLAGASEKDGAVKADGQSLAERIRALQKQAVLANSGDA